MKPAPFQYHRVSTLEEATDLLATLDNARLLSGGQSLMPMMNLRYVTPDHLIDLNPVVALSGVHIGGESVTIGAMTRQRAMMESCDLASICPIFREALRHVGHVQTRNRGTLGGSLAHMDPSAEIMGLAALLDAQITLSRKGSAREIPIADYPVGYMTPAIEPDEVLTSMTFSTWPNRHGWDFREFAQRHGDFAIVGVGSLIKLSDVRKIERASIVLIGVDDGPVRLGEVEDMLAGETPSEQLFHEAGSLAGKREMLGDAIVSSRYRAQLAGILVRRSLLNAAGRAGMAA
jgi:carbon-monoxide dehydrogenase medium subunit